VSQKTADPRISPVGLPFMCCFLFGGDHSYLTLSVQRLMIKMHTSKVDKYGSLFGIGNPRKIHTRARCR